MTPGTGPGVITADGCALELYRRLPPGGEAEIVHDMVPGGTRILDLGCGTGRHLAPGGLLVAQWHPPEWFDTVADGDGGRVGEIDVELTDVRRRGDLLDATVRYTAGDEVWTHSFTARRLDEAALHRELRGAGLSFKRWCGDGRSWFTARGLA